MIAEDIRGRESGEREEGARRSWEETQTSGGVDKRCNPVLDDTKTCAFQVEIVIYLIGDGGGARGGG